MFVFQANVSRECFHEVFQVFLFQRDVCQNRPCSANAEVTGSSLQQKWWNWCGHDDDGGGGDGGVDNDDV